jgi:transcription-repair coupling factor (superfamily II helicase)
VDVLVTPAATAMQRLCPPAYLNAHAFLLKEKDKLDADKLRARLAQAGYHAVNQVLSPGEFAVRGGIIDLFPWARRCPTASTCSTTRSNRSAPSTRTPSARSTRWPRFACCRRAKCPWTKPASPTSGRSFRDRFEGDPGKSQMYKDVSNKLAPGGIEYYLPLFFDETATLFDYLGDDTTLVLHGVTQTAVEKASGTTRKAAPPDAGDKHRPLLAPDTLFLMPDQFFGRLRPYARLEFGNRTEADITLPFLAAPAVEVERKAENPYYRLQVHLDSFPGRTLLVAESLGRRETLANALAEYGLKPTLLEGWPLQE